MGRRQELREVAVGVGFIRQTAQPRLHGADPAEKHTMLNLSLYSKGLLTLQHMSIVIYLFVNRC